MKNSARMVGGIKSQNENNEVIEGDVGMESFIEIAVGAPEASLEYTAKRQRQRVHRDRRAGVAQQSRRADVVHRAGQPMRERICREFQRQAARRAAQRRDLPHCEGGQGADRAMASALQHGATAQLAGLPATSTRSDRCWSDLRFAMIRPTAGRSGDSQIECGMSIGGRSRACNPPNTRSNHATEYLHRQRPFDLPSSERIRLLQKLSKKPTLPGLGGTHHHCAIQSLIDGLA